MLPKLRCASLALWGVAVLAGAVQADLTDSLKRGTPDIKSIGPLAFGPDGVLFIGDPTGAAIFAIDTGDRTPTGAAGPINIPGVDEKIAALLGTSPKELAVNDVIVNPASGNAYFSISRGKGPDALPVLLRVDRQGKMQDLPFKDVKFAKAALANATTKQRMESITDLAYVKGQVIVAGLSNEDFASRLRSIPFPFTDANPGAGIEIFHGAHGRFETNSPVRTFTTYDIGGETNLLAAYTCTPLVRIPVSQLKAGEKVKGTTIAELGNRNRPLDMIVYQKDGKDFILLANNARGVMKITTENIDKTESITKPVTGGGTAGLKYETISTLKGIEQLDKLDKEHALVLVRTSTGSLNLETVPLP